MEKYFSDKKAELQDSFIKGFSPERGARWQIKDESFDRKKCTFGLRAWQNKRGEIKKTLFLMTRFKGEQIRLSWVYPNVGLKEARKQAREAMSMIELGIDPRAPKIDRDEAYGPLARRFIDEKVKVKDEHGCFVRRSWRQTEAMLLGTKSVALKSLKNKPVNEITRRDIADILGDYRKRGHIRMSNCVRGALNQMFKWCIAEGYIDFSPVTHTEKAHGERTRTRVLCEKTEIGALWEAFGKVREPYSHLYRFLLVTGQRVGEVSGMRWDELDTESSVWRIPGARTKNKRSHAVPLTPLALDILRSVREAGKGGAYVFSITGEYPLSNFDRFKKQVDKRLCNKAGEFTLSAPWRAHDLRRTVITQLARLGIAENIVSRIANHTIQGVTAKHYDRYNYDEEKRNALMQWDTELRCIVQAARGENVVSIEKKRAG